MIFPKKKILSRPIRISMALTLSLTALFECNKLTAMLARSAIASVGGFRQRPWVRNWNVIKIAGGDWGSQCTQHYSTILSYVPQVEIGALHGNSSLQRPLAKFLKKNKDIAFEITILAHFLKLKLDLKWLCNSYFKGAWYSITVQFCSSAGRNRPFTCKYLTSEKSSDNLYKNKIMAFTITILTHFQN